MRIYKRCGNLRFYANFSNLEFTLVRVRQLHGYPFDQFHFVAAALADAFFLRDDLGICRGLARHAQVRPAVLGRDRVRGIGFGALVFGYVVLHLLSLRDDVHALDFERHPLPVDFDVATAEKVEVRIVAQVVNAVAFVLVEPTNAIYDAEPKAQNANY